MQMPPGQHSITDFPRFGLTPYAERFPTQTSFVSIKISGDVQSPFVLEKQLDKLNPVDQTSDFHCVTTWSCENLRWSGYRFKDVYENILQSEAGIDPNVSHVIFHAQDGYKNILPLSDLMADDVLFATHLNGQLLSIEHGAPVRLIAPAHYGYKSVKHLKQIDFVRNPHSFNTKWYQSILAHPRGRVVNEERGQILPNWLFRFVFSRAINGTRRRFADAMQQFELRES